MKTLIYLFNAMFLGTISHYRTDRKIATLQEPLIALFRDQELTYYDYMIYLLA